MQTAIDHFMWGYQVHFRIAQESIAKRVFGLIDERLNPQVFVVGILVDKRNDRYPACVEPENDFWIQSEEFFSAVKLTKELRPTYPESRMRQSHPLAQKWQDDSLTRRSIRDSISQIIQSKIGKPADLSYFVSYPAKIESYLVSVVLGLQTLVLGAYPSLLKDQVPIHQCRNMSTPTSFLDAVIATYLDKASGELRLPDPGSGISDLNAEEIHRNAADTLMRTLAFRADQSCIVGCHRLFSASNNLASTYYEKSAGAGDIIIAKKNHPAIQYAVEFMEAARLDSIIGARKLLQLASKGLALHTDSEAIYGIAKVKGYVETEENLFKVRFLDYHHWEVSHANQILMRVKYGQPYLLRPPFDMEKLCKDLPRIFTQITKRQIAHIGKLVNEALKEKHGTMLLITKAAKKESERLSIQGTIIKPKFLTPELLRHLTPIDGAVILNPKGTCYAIGTVLDGMATKAGNPARGSRYNSAIRYVESSRYPCMAIVISEDGGVDFIPNLKPAIKRSLIEEAIAKLKQIAVSEKINQGPFNKTMEWLRQHNYYLLPEHCNDINELKMLIDGRIRDEYQNHIRIVWEDFFPNTSMRPELYYEYEHSLDPPIHHKEIKS